MGFDQVYLKRTISHRTRELTIPRIDCQEDAEAWMRPDHTGRSVVGDVLVNDQRAIRLKQRVETIQDRWTAQVSIVENEPFALLHCIDEDAIDPDKLSFVDGYRRPLESLEKSLRRRDIVVSQVSRNVTETRKVDDGRCSQF
jgi:hypothetical protein